MIENSFLLQKLANQFGEKILGNDEQYGMLTITASKDINLEILKFIYDDEELQFQFMTDLTAVHYPDQLLQLCVVYHMHSLATNTRFRLKFFLPIDNPFIRSATSVYAAANWMERETYDFFGVQFEGHPNLKRILNVDYMEAFPMRKEFPLEDPNRVDKKDSFFGR